MIPSDAFYTLFARTYASYSASKVAYISSVNEFIYKESALLSSLVDVGSGDGKRGKVIANKLNISDVTFIDNSDGMFTLARQIPDVRVIKDDITRKYFATERAYGLVLCLWNVLGHIDTVEGRKNAISNLSKLLTNDGVLIIDVNNRYNCRHYGKMAVAVNIMKDIFTPNDRRGDFDLNINISSGAIKTKVHVFNPREIRNLISSAGLRVERMQVVNYDTGENERRFWNGQLVYKIRKK